MSHGGGGEEESEGSSERWLVSYSDFITLLMVLFVVLYSMSKVDTEKYKLLAESLRTAFTLGGASDIINSQIDETGGTLEDGQPNPIVVPGIPEEPPQSEEVAGELTTMLADQGLGEEVSVQTNIEGVLISLSERLVFVPGTAQLQDDAYSVLDTITGMLLDVDNTIRVVGHTDDTPPTDPRYADNWELSLGRAMVIANYMMDAGISPERLIVSGRGQNEPVFPNDSDEHRALNGRADIIVIYKVDSDMIDVSSSVLDSTGTGK